MASVDENWRKEGGKPQDGFFVARPFIKSDALASLAKPVPERRAATPITWWADSWLAARVQWEIQVAPSARA